MRRIFLLARVPNIDFPRQWGAKNAVSHVRAHHAELYAMLQEQGHLQTDLLHRTRRTIARNTNSCEPAIGVDECEQDENTIRIRVRENP